MKMPIFKISILMILLVLGIYIFTNINVSQSKDSQNRCKKENMPYLNPNLSIFERVDDLMSRMNDQEKIGQMILVEKNSVNSINDITNYNLGALLSGGGGGTKGNTPIEWFEMINKFQNASEKTCLGIPLLYGIDAVHGLGNVFGATIFPHSIGLGATRDPDLVNRIAKATAEEMNAVGIYWNFFPNLDVAKDIRWGKTYETFGSDTKNVAQLGLSYLKGTQDSVSNYYKVLATPKHFIGGGVMEFGTSRNKDFKMEEGNITLDEESLRKDHLIAFEEAIKGGAQSIMVSTASWNGKLNSSNYYLLTELLKNELGFSGFLVSDWYAVYQIAPTKYESLVAGINAGIDMVMTPYQYKDFISNMQVAIAKGDISRERLDDAVRRILTVKFKAGLFDRPKPNIENLQVIGNSKHRELAREAVRKSIVLLKNKDSALPLSSKLKKIIVAGSSADNLGRQAGGWTTNWQGTDDNYGILGTTILEAIRKTVPKDTLVLYDKFGNFSSDDLGTADAGIVVVGEKPYAEGWGDNANPTLSPEDLLAIEKTRVKCKKLIVVIISGRPLNISSYASDWDSIVAAWLPGSEGEGVTDLLFGQYPFTGILPVEWDL